MAKKMKTGLDPEALAVRLLDPADVDDELLGSVVRALGTTGREDSAQLVRDDEQAAALVQKLIGPKVEATASTVKGPATASPAGDTETAASLYGRGKKSAKGKVRF
jgi:hypothetical protein